MKAALPRSATGEEFQEGKFCGRASDVCFRGRGGMMEQGAGAADRLFTPGMIYCSLEDGKDMGRFSFNGAGTSPFFTAAEFPNLFQEAAENRCIGLKILLFEQVEEFFAGQADSHFFQGRESQGNQNFNDETEDGGINPASGSARLRGRGRIAFFPANMRMRRMPPTVPTIEPITGRDMAFFSIYGSGRPAAASFAPGCPLH